VFHGRVAANNGNGRKNNNDRIGALCANLYASGGETRLSRERNHDGTVVSGGDEGLGKWK
jgi:hypothetical protein